MLKLYNTLTRKKEEFSPIKPPYVGYYTCGPTVYDYAHIGNLRTYIFEDALKRALTENGFKVKHVMNITDVGHLTSDADTGEDKMEKGAQREGKTVWEVAEFYTKAFKKDMKRLNLSEPNIWCKATDHIQQQIDLVKQLEERGATYKTSDGIYLDTSKVKDYGKLARLDIEGLKSGARTEMREKKNPTDFALWKLSNPKSAHPEPVEGSPKKRAMEWESPWGVGFPGWHIECSAMSMKYLGDTFDIHCGGIDHIPVHHTNEIAQAETATQKPFALHWCHGEFLVIDKERMGKSEGNLLTLQSIIDKGYDPLSYRYFTFTAHYRQKLNFSWDGLDSAAAAYNKLRDIAASYDEPKIGCAEFEEKFINAVNDDLNIPQALAITWDLVKSDNPASAKKATLLKFDKILGLDLEKAESSIINSEELPDDVQKLLKKREELREQKKFAEADKVREEITKQGYRVEDGDRGQVVRRN